MSQPPPPGFGPAPATAYTSGPPPQAASVAVPKPSVPTPSVAVPSVPTPSVAVPEWNPPADLPLGPLPPLSRFWLWMRLWFQWVYLIPVLAFALACLALLVLSQGEFGLLGALVAVGHLGPLTPRQYRVEARRDVNLWRAHAVRKLGPRTAKAEERELRRRARARTKGRTREPEQPRTSLSVRAYRGLGVLGVAELADASGWAIDWKASTEPRESLSLVCVRPLKD